MDVESSVSRQQRHKRPRQRRASEGINYESSVADLSREGRETLIIVNRKKRLNTIANASCTIFDHMCPRYNWLRPGWIVEERLKPHDRLYRYFYDPIGQMYSTRGEVDQMYADTEKNRAIIILEE